jgi:hypothetical protein
MRKMTIKRVVAFGLVLEVAAFVVGGGGIVFAGGSTGTSAAQGAQGPVRSDGIALGSGPMCFPGDPCGIQP